MVFNNFDCTDSVELNLTAGVQIRYDRFIQMFLYQFSLIIHLQI